jgi:type VI secretion system protein ImpA
MSARWERDRLLVPIGENAPCGENLEDTGVLTAFDRFRLFGQLFSLDTPPDPEDEKRGAAKWEPRNWVEVRDQALDAVERSKDLRLLACLATALLRTDGLSAFLETVIVASDWLDTYWDDTFPRLDDDALVRRNALNCFADPMAVVEALRRAPLVSSRQHGTFGLRDIDLSTRQIQPGKNDVVVDGQQIQAAFDSMPLTELTALHGRVVTATVALKSTEAKMQEAPAGEVAFGPLAEQLKRMAQVLAARIALHPEAPKDMAPALNTDDGAGALTPAGSLGVVRSRQEAIQALDAVAAFFRQTEPSSPIPLRVARAKRLVSKDFLDVLADIAPDAVAHARSVAGLKDGD